MKRHGYNETELRAMTMTRLDTTIKAIAEANGGKARGDGEHRTYTAKRRRRKKS